MRQNTDLAILGGSPCIAQQFRNYNSIGPRDIEAALNVLKTGKLSQFVGSSGEFFLGGNSVKAMELMDFRALAGNWCTWLGTWI